MRVTNQQLNILLGCPLFVDIQPANIPAMLGCLGARISHYAKGDTIFAAGAAIHHMGVVISGRLLVEQDDYWGNRGILAQLEPGELFAEAFSCAGTQRLPVSVLAAEEAQVMLLDSNKIITSCSSSCAFHSRLVHNMLQILAQKNVMLTQKIETVTQRSTRGKLLSYLSAQAQRQGSPGFVIPFNRQELADYLAVDRSAMSSELSKMQREGILDYNKNSFTLK